MVVLWPRVGLDPILQPLFVCWPAWLLGLSHREEMDTDNSMGKTSSESHQFIGYGSPTQLSLEFCSLVFRVTWSFVKTL